MARTPNSVLLATLLFALLAYAVAAPCDFPVDPSWGSWVGPPSNLTECFNSISLDPTERTTTQNVISRILDLYSYGDIAQSDIAPYNVSVRLSSFHLDIISTSVAVLAILYLAHFQSQLLLPPSLTTYRLTFCLSISLSDIFFSLLQYNWPEALQSIKSATYISDYAFQQGMNPRSLRPIDLFVFLPQALLLSVESVHFI